MECFAFRKIIDPFSFLILVYILFFIVWIIFGFPSLFSKLLLLDQIPVRRAKIGPGAADLILLVALLSQRSREYYPIKSKYGIAFVLSLWFVLMVYVGIKVKTVISILTNPAVFLIALWLTVIVFLVIKKIRFSMVFIAAFCLYISVWFNPLVLGGANFFNENDLSEKIIELDAKTDGNSTWVTYNSLELANLFRMIGVKSVNGVHFYPQFKLWSKLDALLKYKSAYNRYAHVRFAIPEKNNMISFSNPQHDVLIVAIHPDNALFSELDIDYILYIGSKRLLDNALSLDWVCSIGEKHIYKVRKNL
ncbi:MAG: hypothetical protein Q8Q33_01820 [Chlamydiota bacterium]|nr:hypothetical protein [Chlamydiota bacterium]